MNTVDRDLLGLQYDADLLESYSILKDWLSKSDNQSIKDILSCVLRIDTYVKALQNERYFFDKLISENLSDKLRAIERARKSEERIEELEKEVEHLKLKIKIYE